MLQPNYLPYVSERLDEIEKDTERQSLWHGLCDAIDLICDHPGSEQARRELVRHSDQSVFQVPVRSNEERQWVLWWWLDGDDAAIFDIGPGSRRT